MYEFERVEILDQLLEKILSMRGFDGFKISKGNLENNNKVEAELDIFSMTIFQHLGAMGKMKKLKRKIKNFHF